MKRYICIHGHFYQPPRENPWLEEVELQDSAHPFHDWNDRITAQCYGPNAFSRILDGDGNIIDIVNNYSKISFNFGPTLLSWMEDHRPEVYEAVIEADRVSVMRFSGHGSTIAQVYNHMIMPLARTRDKYTQVIWGIEDFKKRFGRRPEGMWLPETAADLETLDILAEMGIRFTILSPRQASRVRRVNGSDTSWMDVSDERIDPTAGYVCNLPSGRSINLFFYDGPISRNIAFADLLSSGERLRDTLYAAFRDGDRDWPQLVHIATDGETYGHHHKQGEMALSYCLSLIENDDSVILTNYGEYLERHGADFEVEIHENSSWSCVHGVERWKEDCGCNSGMKPGWSQAWRRPLRDAMDRLREISGEIFDSLGKRYFKDPDKALDAYIHILLDRSFENMENFFREHAKRMPIGREGAAVIKLLEMQRFSHLIFTSCGWFFDEISGIETVQVLQYAARAIQLAEELTGRSIEPEFVEMLRKAPSNVFENGANVFESYVKPAKVDLLRVGSHYAISSLFEDHPEEYTFGAYIAVNEALNRKTAGRSSLVTGRTRIASVITREEVEISYAALHLGDHNVSCGVDLFHDPDEHRTMETDVTEAFERGDVTECIRRLGNNFGRNTYSIYHLFRDEQRKIVGEILEPMHEAAEASYLQIFEANYAVLNFLRWLNVPPSRQLLDAVENVVNTQLLNVFNESELDTNKVESVMDDAQKFSVRLEREAIGFRASKWIEARMADFEANPDDFALLERIVEAVGILARLPVDLNLAGGQNIYFRMGRRRMDTVKGQAEAGKTSAKLWLKAFLELGALLKVKLA